MGWDSQRLQATRKSERHDLTFHLDTFLRLSTRLEWRIEAFLWTEKSPGILIVDDNEDNRYTLQLLLETDGHERIASASGGNEAIALLEKEKFSLVLLDMMMPDLNGDQVLKIIKGNPDTRDTPVVMISADTDIEKVSKCIELGADDYLPKPFNPTILRARIALGAAPAIAARDGRRISSEGRGREAAFRESAAQHSPAGDRRAACATGKATSPIISTKPR